MNGASTRRPVLAAFGEEERPAGDAVGIELVEHAFQGYYNLRCDPADESIAAAASEALGAALPTEPNRVTEGNDVSLYWLAPDEWLLRTPAEDDRTRVDDLAARLAGHWFALTDLSGGMTHLSVGGSAAAEVLAQGTTLDLHPRVFEPGQCAQTILAHANVLIAPRDTNAPGFDLFVRRSFADHVLNFLQDAAHDVGYCFSRRS